MQVDEMQIGMQIPNSYHSFQIERGERMETDSDKDKTIDAEMMPKGTRSAIQMAEREEERMNMNLMDRPVTAVQNDPMSTGDNRMENAPGAIVDIQA